MINGTKKCQLRFLYSQHITFAKKEFIGKQHLYETFLNLNFTCNEIGMNWFYKYVAKFYNLSFLSATRRELPQQFADCSG